jgi:hypothetical protein
MRYPGFWRWVRQTLIHDPEKLNRICILYPPCSSICGASKSLGLGKKVAAVMKACEIKTVVELTKIS